MRELYQGIMYPLICLANPWICIESWNKNPDSVHIMDHKSELKKICFELWIQPIFKKFDQFHEAQDKIYNFRRPSADRGQRHGGMGAGLGRLKVR